MCRQDHTIFCNILPCNYWCLETILIQESKIFYSPGDDLTYFCDIHAPCLLILIKIRIMIKLHIIYKMNRILINFRLYAVFNTITIAAKKLNTRRLIFTEHNTTNFKFTSTIFTATPRLPCFQHVNTTTCMITIFSHDNHLIPFQFFHNKISTAILHRD